MALKKKLLPVIPTRGFIIFPETVFHFDVAREKSIAAIEKAVNQSGLLFLAAQKDDSVEEPTTKDVYEYGIVVKVRQLMRHSDGGIRVLVEGISRGKLASALFVSGAYEAEVSFLNSSTRDLSSEEYAAILNQIHLLINDFIEISPKLASAEFLKNLPETQPSSLCDMIASNLVRRNDDKQTLLATANVKKRLMKLINILAQEVKILDVENSIANRVKEQMEENNREYFLREQIKAIKEELGDEYDDVRILSDKLDSLALPEEVYEKAMRELKNLERLPQTSPENAISRHYLDVICELPWDKQTEENRNLSKAERILERDHYGMEKVKKRIIQQLAVINRTNVNNGSVLCLLGAPGVGKTSVAKSIAEATGRNFVRISLGGMKDESELRGHRKTYVGAMPGRIAEALRKAKSNNPLILLDEIDKIGSDYKGDPASALLEILDPEQNKSFRDNFLEVGLDLSNVLFLATANTTETVPSPLLDRLEVIELSSYTDEEKLSIAKKYLVTKQKKKHGLEGNILKISDGAIRSIIENYTREAGVRGLEREIASVCRQCAAIAEKEGRDKFSVTEKNLSEYLGPVKYLRDEIFMTANVGTVNGLAWTQVGGEVLVCEAVVLDGSGKLSLTGKLGDVMKESATIAASYVRSISGQYSIDKEFYKNKDIHIHFPEGAVPKDGPSAGITIATAILSALTNVPVRGNVAMTGEISLRGRVLPIGGLKEKILGAYRLGIREIIIPKANDKDLKDVPSDVLSRIIVHKVESCEEVFKICLVNTSRVNVVPPAYKRERNTEHEYS
ncbi:MAG: endopeptidase La [Clostridia bacterium]|nr:endopeptidase La [Clostridia bacterium]